MIAHRLNEGTRRVEKIGVPEREALTLSANHGLNRIKTTFGLRSSPGTMMTGGVTASAYGCLTAYRGLDRPAAGRDLIGVGVAAGGA
jgi:hypothetical protein